MVKYKFAPHKAFGFIKDPVFTPRINILLTINYSFVNFFNFTCMQVYVMLIIIEEKYAYIP